MAIYSKVDFSNPEEASRWAELVRSEINPKIYTIDDTGTPSVKVGKVFKTGGTTTITDFTGGATGQEITILAEHSVTITDGTNIFLNGSANYAMTASDTLKLVLSDDGNWYEVSRSVN